ncbi:MAG: glycosyltransferase family 4 protein [bacterium]
MNYKILILVNNYPFKGSKDYIFLKQLVDHFSKEGNECLVISPQSLIKIILGMIKKRPYKLKYNENSKKEHALLSPKCIMFPTIKILRNINHFFLKKTILKALKKTGFIPDFIYVHHLAPSGYIAQYISKNLKIPYFISFGESTFDRFYNHFNHNKLNLIFKNCSGLIAVSNEMKKRLLSLPYDIDKNNIFIAPNGYNPNLFYKINKEETRKKLKLPDDKFIISFVGDFIERKGPLRVSKALNEINNNNIGALFIGKGPQIPNYKNSYHIGFVQHNMLNSYLNASDVFVLPTLNEGSCNAIIEAMACGLPIISSNAAFNDDLLDDKNSIRINSNNNAELKEAILNVFNNKLLLEKMSERSLQISKELHIDKRAKNILDFIGSKINR